MIRPPPAETRRLRAALTEELAIRSPRSNARRLGAGARNIALSLSVLALLGIASEIALRLCYVPENLGTVIRFDPRLGWSLRPDARLRSVDHQRGLDYRIRINSMGLREREFELSREHGGRRFLFLGDSVTFGDGVEQGWRFSDFLGRALGDGARVINAGVPGWGNDQELLFFEAVRERIRPNLVILTLTLSNDVVNNMLDHLFLSSAPKPRFVLEGDSLALTDTDFHAPVVPNVTRIRRWLKKSRFVLFVKRRLDRARYAHMARRSMAPLPRGFSKKSFEENYSHWSVYRRAYDPEMAEAWRVTEAILLRLSRECHDIGAEFIVFAFPLRVEVDDAWRKEMIRRAGIDADLIDVRRPYARLEAFCRRSGIEFVYPLEDFREGLARRYLYFDRDNHPNRFGHALAARVLARELQRRYHLEIHFAETGTEVRGGPQ
ncbi:MAG: SGNH/GDSL hydrolase family protein [Myxococcota bacterium]